MAAVPTSAQRAQGFLLIFLVALIWSASSFISKALVSDKHHDGHAAVPPFVLTYLATSLFIIYLPFVYIRLWFKQRRLRHRAERVVLTSVDSAADEGSEEDLIARYEQDEQSSVKAAAWAGPLWFIAQYTFNISLVYTTVTSNTILSSSSSLFTYLMSIAFLGERYTHGKLLSIIACIAGVAMVALSDQETGATGTLWGDVLVVFSDCVYAMYTIVMKRYMPDEESANIPLFFGYIGLFVSLALCPVVVYYVASGGFDMASIPKEVYMLILLEGVLDYVVSDYFWAKAVLIIGPTMATLALSVQIPMAAFGDIISDDAAWTKHWGTIMMTVGGTLLIVAGFVGINLGDEESSSSSSSSSSSNSAAAGSSSRPLRSTSQQGLAGWAARVYRQGLTLLGLDGKGSYSALNTGLIRKASKDAGVDTLPDAVLLGKDGAAQGSSSAAGMKRVLNRWLRGAPPSPSHHSVDELIDDGVLG